MSRSEREKGARGELEVSQIYREFGFAADRVPNSGGLLIKGDLYGDVPEHVEVKRQEVLRPRLWIAQAELEAGSLPWVVAFRQNGTGWYGITPLERHIALLRLHTDHEGASHELADTA